MVEMVVVVVVGGGVRRRRRRGARSVVRSDRVWRRLLRSEGRLTGFWTGCSGLRPVDRVLRRTVRSGGRLTGFETGFVDLELSLSCSSPNQNQIDQNEGKRWNWRLKVGEIVDQAQQHQIHGAKPLKTQPNHRSVQRQFRAIFWKIF